MYRVIMVPVDGSAFSRGAVLQGLRIAERSKATLRLVYVRSTPALGAGPDGLAIESRVRRDHEASEVSDLYALAADCRDHSRIRVTASVEDGPVPDALRGHAIRHGVDLIVMATHARQGLARLWLGSVADKLIRDTGIPVLVVRPPSIATGIDTGFRFRKILVPLDGSELAEQSIEPALRLARLEDADITLLRVVASEENLPPGELHAASGPARARDIDDARSYLEEKRHALIDAGVEAHAATVISGDVPAAILSYAKSRDFDLIAVATHGRTGLARAMVGSVADKVMCHAFVSTLIVRPAAIAANRVEVPVLLEPGMIFV